MQFSVKLSKSSVYAEPMTEHEVHDLPVTRLAQLIAERKVSSRELLDLYASRIEAMNPAVNAVITLDLDRATAAASVADAETAAGRSTGPLHGIPITVKDALAVAGMRSTGGAIEHTDHVPERDADVVAAVRAAGAIPFAKTNVPRWSGDIQTFNDIFGTSNNPWDTSLVPGGSSGGAATAVALGFTGFELGTDIGGSIRIPAAYCGVVGHKPSFGLVPCGGYLDRVDYGTTEPDINVHGPLTRSVDDAELLLDIIAGPPPDRAVAVRHELPAARHRRIDEYRVAVWSSDASCPSSIDTISAVEGAADVLASLGARLDREARPDIDANAASQLGGFLIASATTPALGVEETEFFAALTSSPDTPADVAQLISPYTTTHQSWLAADVTRAQIRRRWAAWFGEVDALICPVIVTPPFPHVQTGTIIDRTITIDGSERPYIDLLWWTMLIGMAYLPATVIPVGFTSGGLPLAVQVVGPFMEDRTPLDVARAIRNALGPITFPAAPITR